jgi:hypothetical protein
MVEYSLVGQVVIWAISNAAGREKSGRSPPVEWSASPVNASALNEDALKISMVVSSRDGINESSTGIDETFAL